MKRIIFLIVAVLGMIFSSGSSFAEEMKAGEIKVVESGFQIISVHFRGVDGRNCIVDVEVINPKQEISSKRISFDWEKEERKFSIGDTEFLIFYVVRGLAVYVDDKEI